MVAELLANESYIIDLALLMLIIFSLLIGILMQRKTRHKIGDMEKDIVDMKKYHWADEHPWRARPYYAALTAKIVSQHARALIDQCTCPYALLSSDSAFVGTWGNRTLMARFASDGKTSIRQFDLIKKPILSFISSYHIPGIEQFESSPDSKAMRNRLCITDILKRHILKVGEMHH